MQSLLAYRGSMAIPQHFQRNRSTVMALAVNSKINTCLHLLHHVSKQHSAKFTWDYFATGHGKGVVDEIGGEAKSMV